ncbi:MAG: hypothetical protein JXQ84_03250, partial [Rhodospirillaceae bacterium]|nr:hypothetical protein [Rhodospirillaceae bacterium]
PDAPDAPDAATPPQPDATKDGASPPSLENPLTIPPEAAKSGDASFLDGKWTSKSGLMDSRTGLPAVVEYDFKGGQGTATIRRSDGTVCVGKSRATVQNGKVVISGVEDPRCGDGSSYARAQVECVQGPDGKAVCSGKSAKGSAYSVDMSR